MFRGRAYVPLGARRVVDVQRSGASRDDGWQPFQYRLGVDITDLTKARGKFLDVDQSLLAGELRVSPEQNPLPTHLVGLRDFEDPIDHFVKSFMHLDDVSRHGS